MHGASTKLLLVTAEFWAQGDREHKHGLKVGQLNDRKNGRLSASQFAFVSYVSKPLLDCLTAVLPVFTEEATRLMNDNMDAWQQLIALGE